MDIKKARRTVCWPQKSAAHYDQLPAAPTRRKVCTYWLEGRCNQNPGRFLHDASLPHNTYHQVAKRSSCMPEDCPGKGPVSSPVNSPSPTTREKGGSSTVKNPQKPQDKVCHYWMLGDCVKGGGCPFLHWWFHSDDFAMLAKLDGHKKLSKCHCLSGIKVGLDSLGKPVLLCACIDNIVRLYDLPSFTERGKIFSRQELRTLQTAPGGLFFTGDATGMLAVWNWLGFPKSQKEQLPGFPEAC